MKPIRVMIVEDSPTMRSSLAQAIGADARLEVVAECASAERALAKLDQTVPDVISMDVHLPGISGLEATRRIMEHRPTPIVIVSRSVCAADVDCTMQALRAGAVSAVEKPARRLGADSEAMMRRLCRELAVMSHVQVVRQRFNRPENRSIVAADCSPGALATARSSHAASLHMRTPNRGIGTSVNCPSIVGIVASTGGPRALECVLAALGPDFSLPIVLVQHITASFQKGFISWLDRIAPQPVVEAIHGGAPVPGCVYVAPAMTHLVLRRDRFSWDDRPPIGGHRPSGTLLLESLAESYGAHAVGVVLTGMGDDGAAGLLSIRRAGGLTLAEDASTAVVNGMPEAARVLGAASASVPLEDIGAALRSAAPARPESGP